LELARHYLEKRVDPSDFFQASATVNLLRGHNVKLFQSRSRLLYSEKNFFSQRVVTHWNSLPQHVLEATSVNCEEDSTVIGEIWTFKARSFEVHYQPSSKFSYSLLPALSTCFTTSVLSAMLTLLPLFLTGSCITELLLLVAVRQLSSQTNI